MNTLSTVELTPDQVEAELIRLEGIVARVRQLQAHLLDRVVELRMPRMDGARSLVDWVSARLDVTRETARDLARVARCDDIEDLVAGDVSFDRAVVRARLIEAGASKEAVADADRYDIAGVRRLACHHRRLTRRQEREAVERRGLWFEDNLDGSEVRLWGRLAGRDGRLVREALDTIADTVPRDAAPTRHQRLADALVMLCRGDQAPAQPAATVIVDARLAAPSDGAAGVAVLAGPKLGRQALEAILCGGTVEVIGLTADGTPLGVGTISATVPPKLRRFVLARDGGCVVEGCTSTYRLEAHHRLPASRGGSTEADNLVALCWHHHHTVIHGRGYHIDPHSPPGRIRLQPPGRPPPR